ncbi:hypothetical protein O0235_10800 [Tepidiforma flava]|uniref:nucleoside-diphosphate kinase n=1 Tax=Tepidiforma flava TaxID=3004094 RepID=A0ABY7M3Z6_9CHLR|nr:nucleoside-diphosphate kinase [Tepidiforma flava]WBL35271.1 hypothetical protein O0235_10800 [Tepidiforma flava]
MKPDAMQRGLAGEIIARLERRGLKIVGMKLLRVTRELAERHYAEHAGKPFFPGLVEFITSAPVIGDRVGRQGRDPGGAGDHRGDEPGRGGARHGAGRLRAR